MSSEVLCTLSGITKRFAAVEALCDVHLDLSAGEIHALVGENGAGKSTLVKIVTGILPPDAGRIRFNGHDVTVNNPREARSLGIAAAHQELELFGQIPAAENCFVQSTYPRRFGSIRWNTVKKRAQQALGQLGAAVPLNKQVRFLSASQRQLVEIAGTLIKSGETVPVSAQHSGHPRLLILDEPTAALSSAETVRLFKVLRRLTAAGTSVLYISHRLSEIFALADRVTVLRDGRNVWTKQLGDTDRNDVIRAMIGRDLGFSSPKLPVPGTEVMLDIKRCTDPVSGRFRNVTFQVRSGEIVGLYGLVGSGRTEFAEALFGLRRIQGQVVCNGVSGPFSDPRRARSAGMAYLPEDRLTAGGFPALTVRDNISIASLAPLSCFGFISSREECARSSGLIRQLGIRPQSMETVYETLSGGNQQKALLARWLANEPAVWILDEPTRGIDVGARAQIHRLIGALAEQGKAVMLISSDLPEVCRISHRVIVFREGEPAAAFDAKRSGEEEIGRAALPVQAGGDMAAQRPEARSAAAPFARFLAQRETAVLAVMAAIALFMQLHSPGFLGFESLCNIAAGSASVAVAAVGMTFVIAAGAIDISAGSMLALSAAGCAIASRAGVPVPVALGFSVAIGLAAGVVNAAICSAGRLHPIITTLGTMGIFRGVFLLWTGGSWIKLPPVLLSAATTGPFGVPWTVVVMAAVVAVSWWFSRYRTAGRQLLMFGDNEDAARLYGISKHRVRFTVFAVAGALTGISAVLFTARYGQVQSNTGIGFELQVIAAALIGGANIHGGRGTVWGAAAGAFLLGVLGEARSMLGIHERWQLIGVGALMLCAIGMESLLKRIFGEDGGGGS